MEKREVIFKREKETKNMVRFEEIPGEGKPPIMNNVYLAKWVVGATDTIKVTIEEG